MTNKQQLSPLERLERNNFILNACLCGLGYIVVLALCGWLSIPFMICILVITLLLALFFGTMIFANTASSVRKDLRSLLDQLDYRTSDDKYLDRIVIPQLKMLQERHRFFFKLYFGFAGNPVIKGFNDDESAN